ncbi:glycosyltransferase family 1 protein [Salinibacterium sp. ZJ454]|uniref:glycosyltransferase family 4 protein n=1 Tax=Salinibacterium sp. ZJ454 TaxID=2708339 RepID=UPI001420A07B|nr:glycosyltransferase family 1 protein [Salinibacterium sp. ZJ454]
MKSDTVAKLGIIANALGAAPANPSADLIAEAAGEPDHAVSYLVLAVLYEEIPHPDLIKGFTRRWRLDGLVPLVDEHAKIAGRRRRSKAVPTRVVSDVVADVTDTARSRFTTGIQRVARETLSRWWIGRDIELVTWDQRTSRFLSASPEEAERVVLQPVVAGPVEFIIPFRATLFLPEIAVDDERAARLRTIARFSGGRSIAIGFDCIPVTTAETAGPGMPGAFSKYLSTLARFDAVAPISKAAGREYRGWRRMLSGAGLTGPEITDLPLPFNANPEPRDRASIEATRAELGLDDAPVVLSVGSREPRKNHLSLLHAAELNWRAGHEFALVLVGGNSWETQQIDEFVSDLRRKNRRIIMLSGVSDEMVWDLYATARFSVFCSINEGFGLPVVESLAYRTPVITSNFGSMRDLGEGRGALLANPHDPEQMAEAMRLLLTSDEEVARLSAEAANLPTSSWDHYAEQLWQLA